MKKILLILSFFIIFSTYAQENTIQEIREKYKYIQENIEYQRDSLIPFDNLKIKLSQNMPAIGQQFFDYEFYFSLEYDDENEGEYFHQLNFATKKYNIAASYFSYEEFLFDEKEQLIFYFIKYETGYAEPFKREVRCYFKDNKLIKILIKEAVYENNGEEPDVYKQVYESTNTIPKYFNGDYNQIKNTVENIKDIYNKFK